MSSQQSSSDMVVEDNQTATDNYCNESDAVDWEITDYTEAGDDESDEMVIHFSNRHIVECTKWACEHMVPLDAVLLASMGGAAAPQKIGTTARKNGSCVHTPPPGGTREGLRTVDSFAFLPTAKNA
jgi:hypothetical protein